MHDPPTKKELLRVITVLAGTLAVAALLIGYFIKDRFGAVVLYVGVPLLVGAMVFIVFWAARLALRGRMPPDISPIIPLALKPLLIWWTLTRIASFAAILAILVGTVVSGLVGLGISTGVHAIICVVMFDLVTKIVVGTYLNALIMRRKATLKL